MDSKQTGFQKRLRTAGASLLVLAGALVLARVFLTPRPEGPEVFHLDGRTMGTLYRIQVVGSPKTAGSEWKDLAKAMEQRLEEVNALMSIWDPESEVSRFNRHRSPDPFPVSDELGRLVKLALDVAERSGGAFDPTVAPLVNLWGFGPEGRSLSAPDSDALAAARACTGFRRLSISEGALRKDCSGLHLDLGAIAKGYGVDAIAQIIRARGFSNFLVEIGGDLYAEGHNAQDEPWAIGVDRPALDGRPGEAIHAILGVTGAGVATSGDYRNYRRTIDGRMMAHIVDPRRGEPVQAAVSSVTVWAQTATLADALATTLFVLGPEEGLAWLADAYPEAQALFLVSDGNGGFRERATPAFSGRTGFRRMDPTRSDRFSR